MHLNKLHFGEQYFDMIENFTKSKVVDLIIVDSVSALTPSSEIYGEFGDSQMGTQARLMGQGMRKLAATLAHNNTSLIFLNQVRHAIGIVFGSKERTSGGNALKFYSSIRLRISRSGVLGSEDKAYGIKSKIKCVKNKVGKPFRKVELELNFEKGFNQIKIAFVECDNSIKGQKHAELLDEKNANKEKIDSLIYFLYIILFFSIFLIIFRKKIF